MKRTVEKTFVCTVLDQMDESFHGTTEVTFTGEYTDYLMRRDSFRGRIDCSEYKLMSADASHTQIRVGTIDEFLNYSPDGTHPDIRYTAAVCLEENLDSFFIWVYVPDENTPGASHGRFFITCPDRTLQDLYAILDKQYS